LSDRWVWDRYWQCDRIASCFDGAGATNYDESVGAGWKAFFAALPDNARIIDLCTGNGAISLMAAEVGAIESKNFSITAVDQADIDPASYVSRHGEEMAAISFVGLTEIEALPFPDSSFDVVISQYGFEYSDMPRAVRELARVLAPGAQLRFVVHAAEGAVAANARPVVADADMLLDTIGLIGASRRCFDAIARVERGGDPSAIARQQACAAVEAFKTALRLTAGYAPKAADSLMFQNSGGVLLDAFEARSSVGFDAVQAKIDRVEAEILAHRGRLQALIDAALDRAGVETLKARLAEAGAKEVGSADLESSDGLIGYVITARFASAISDRTISRFPNGRASPRSGGRGCTGPSAA
jgi:SAM-dependent methyltransferase